MKSVIDTGLDQETVGTDTGLARVPVLAGHSTGHGSHFRDKRAGVCRCDDPGYMGLSNAV